MTRLFLRAGRAVPAACTLALTAGLAAQPAHASPLDHRVPTATAGRAAGPGALPDLPTKAEALERLDSLKVDKSRGKFTAYDRKDFGIWGEHTVNGKKCTVFDAVVHRDRLSGTPNGCKITGGTWPNPYNATGTITSERVSVDHIVALRDAFESGANKWGKPRKRQFGNDLSRPQLLVVAQADNSSKGNKSPGEWLVPNNYGGFACDYARAYVQVKYHYGLSILETDPKNTKIKKQIHDKTALQKALNTCP
ncbi:HNH endonuclease family protein [Streptomyces rimosus]|uniref:HNH endonuclease n=1 Tax=Streptomyces rimosus TaxID=1927 RepID=UPI0006B26CB1|nr:HNH endonuclease [Streptomyces rimosus]